MPRLKKSPREQLGANILANIAFYASYYGYKRTDIQRIAGFSSTTYDNRQKRPYEFKVIELQRLADSFHVSINDLFVKPKDVD